MMATGFSPLILSLFLHLLVQLHPSAAGRCSEEGPLVRFPFLLNGHGNPEHCAYSDDFRLSCDKNSTTIIELPTSVRLAVRDIDYKAQIMRVFDPAAASPCLLTHFRNLNLSTSTPFQLHHSDQFYNYSFFSCSHDIDTSPYPPRYRTCLGDPIPTRKVYAVYSGDTLGGLISCKKMYTISSIPDEVLHSPFELTLNWSNPAICPICEAKNQRCGFNHTTNSTVTQREVQCFRIPGSPITDLLRGLFLLILIMIATYCGVMFIKSMKDDQKRIEMFLKDYRAFKPSRYSFADIKRITAKFRYKIGQGGFGTVYKGKLSNDVHVAVKILNNVKGNGEEFINEVRTIGRIHHVNVVRLVGYCADGLKRALVYEFLPNQSLEKYISSDKDKQALGWEKLQRIALGIAKGIEYLHQGCDQRILHFDIKPNNILLDRYFNAKIADFGLAKLCSKDQSAVSMTVARGTVGYIAPEMFSRNFGNVSYKSDVYSFGMLLLEIVGMRNNNVEQNTSEVYFPEWIYSRINHGEELGIELDVEDEDAKSIAKKLTIVGLWCIQWNPIHRPSMKVVLQMLEGNNGSVLVPPPNPFDSTNPVMIGSHMSETISFNTQLLEVIPECE